MHAGFWARVSLYLGMFAEKKDDCLDLTTATWDAETSGKTVSVKPDRDKLMEQWKSGDRTAKSFVAGTSFQFDCTSDTVKPLWP